MSIVVSKLKVAQLKSELAARNLPTSGLKAVLSERLQQALDQESQTKQGPVFPITNTQATPPAPEKRARSPSSLGELTRPSKITNRSPHPSPLNHQPPVVYQQAPTSSTLENISESQTGSLEEPKTTNINPSPPGDADGPISTNPPPTTNDIQTLTTETNLRTTNNDHLPVLSSSIGADNRPDSTQNQEPSLQNQFASSDTHTTTSSSLLQHQSESQNLDHSLSASKDLYPVPPNASISQPVQIDKVEPEIVPSITKTQPESFQAPITIEPESVSNSIQVALESVGDSTQVEPKIARDPAQIEPESVSQIEAESVQAHAQNVAIEDLPPLTEANCPEHAELVTRVPSPIIPEEDISAAPEFVTLPTANERKADKNPTTPTPDNDTLERPLSPTKSLSKLTDHRDMAVPSAQSSTELNVTQANSGTIDPPLQLVSNTARPIKEGGELTNTSPGLLDSKHLPTLDDDGFKDSIKNTHTSAKQHMTGPDQPPPTRSLYISNLVRPLTVPQLKNKLSEFGEITYFWIDSVKSHAYVTFETESAALATYSSMHQTDPWPPETGKMLVLVFVPDNEVSRLVSEEEENVKTRGRGRLALHVVREENRWKFELRPMNSGGSIQQPRGLASSSTLSQVNLISSSQTHDLYHPKESTHRNADSNPTNLKKHQIQLPDLQFEKPEDNPKGGPERWFKKTQTRPHLFYLPYAP